MQGKQAKIVSPIQERALLGYLATTRYPARDRVMFLLSMKAGLRAKEMASLTWAMVTDAQGQVAEVLHVPNRASKGKTGGRTIPLHPDLQAALVTLQRARRYGHPRAADPLLGAGGRVVGCHRALVVPSAVYVAENGRLFVALWSPDVHYPCRPQSLAGRRESPGRPRTRGAYQPGDDATLHRGRYRGQAQARRAHLSRALQGAPWGVAPQRPGPCHTRLSWRCVRWRGRRPPGRAALPLSTPAATRAGDPGQRQAPLVDTRCAARAARDRAKNSGVRVPCSPGPSAPDFP
jgi:integrase